MSASSPSQTVFSIGYDFHAGNRDNDNVWGIINNKDNTRSQTFTYDPLNRLASAQNAGTDCSKTTVNGKTDYWGNSYGYDAWGNLLSKSVTKCSAENLSVTAAVNNQLQGGYTYDAAGNMLHDATANANYAYDQENRISGAAGFTYTYDADGNRVEKSNGTTGTLYWYMSPGVVAESDLSGNLQSEYVFFDGERVARKDFPGNAVSYYFSDHLKTTDIVTDAQGNIKNESDFYPWGGELQFLNNDSNHYKFTGKERDAETGLDYFGARYYSNGLGRFITPDWSATPVPVPYADLTDPQTLNQYSYVRNIPTVRVDTEGHDGCCTLADLEELVNRGIEEGRAMIDAMKPAAPLAPLLPTVPAAVPIVTLGAAPVAATVFAATHPIEAPAEGCLGPYCDMYVYNGTQATTPPQTQTQTPDPQMAGHRKGARESTRQTHEEGDARRRRDRGGEKGDARRRPPRKRPPGWKGPWPPKPPDPPKPPEKPPEQPPEQPEPPKEKDKT